MVVSFEVLVWLEVESLGAVELLVEVSFVVLDELDEFDEVEFDDVEFDEVVALIASLAFADVPSII